MKAEITCKWLRVNWLIILCSTLETERCYQIRDHLAGCIHCRNEFGSYFPVELRQNQDLPEKPISADFTGRVLHGLGITEHSKKNVLPAKKPMLAEWWSQKCFRFVPTIKFPPIVANYLASAAVTLVLIYSGYFNLLPRVEIGATMLNSQVGKIFSQTQTRGKAELKTLWLKVEVLSNMLRINRQK